MLTSDMVTKDFKFRKTLKEIFRENFLCGLQFCV